MSISWPSKPKQREDEGSRPYAILQAPSILGLKPNGVEKLGEALLGHGLGSRLKARHAGVVHAPAYEFERDPSTLTLNAEAIANYTPRLADEVEAILKAGEFPVILGGDCSIVLGATLALKRRGRFGLLFIDGHADFYQPEVNPNGEAASMDLAFATGYGPNLLTNIEGRKPLVRSEDTVLFGFRDSEEQAEFGSQPLPSDLRSFDLAAVRELGVESLANDAVSHLTRAGLDGFFIHLDADSVSDHLMPAVDYRIPDGLSWDELGVTLRAALASGRAVGMEVTIYNPSLDPDGRAGRDLVATLAGALGTHAPRLIDP